MEWSTSEEVSLLENFQSDFVNLFKVQYAVIFNPVTSFIIYSSWKLRIINLFLTKTKLVPALWYFWVTKLRKGITAFRDENNCLSFYLSLSSFFFFFIPSLGMIYSSYFEIAFCFSEIQHSHLFVLVLFQTWKMSFIDVTILCQNSFPTNISRL